jgi:HEAT repeat protein
MATAAYSERERGHTGNYFNYVWALQGVARSGPKAMGAYLKEQSWYYDFARGWDTAFVYQASPEGEEEHHKYTNWDCTGSHLLAFALPLKSLRLTGKKPFTITPLTDSQVAGIIAAGRDLSYRGDPDFYEKRSTEELLEGLASWSPFVRKRSAAALGKRDGDFVPGLLKLLIGKDRDSRYGACQALGALGKRADIAAPQLRAALREDDPWLQCLAAEAIRELSPAERNGSVTDLLAVTVRQNPSDPRRHAALYVSTVLFSRFPGTKAPQSILEASLEGVDREKLYPAIQSLLKHSDSIARSSVSKTYSSLTDRDIVTLLPDIISATRGLAPSNEMFADGVRVAGLDLLSRLGIREGMELCVIVLEPDRWGFKNRADKCLKFILRYGAHAKTMLPKLLESRRLAMDRKASAEVLAQFDKTIAAIESSTAEPTLVGVSEFTQKR